MPTKAVKKEALKTLDGVIQIAKNEMLTQGTYGSKVVDKELAKQGAVCGGRRACLVGSLYLANGRNRFNYRTQVLAGVAPERRKRFMSDKPGLKLAYDALNQAAKARISRLPERIRAGVVKEAEGDFRFDDSRYDVVGVGYAEAYFEYGLDTVKELPWAADGHGLVDRRKIVSLVQSAKKIVEAA